MDDYLVDLILGMMVVVFGIWLLCLYFCRAEIDWDKGPGE